MDIKERTMKKINQILYVFDSHLYLIYIQYLSKFNLLWMTALFRSGSP